MPAYILKSAVPVIVNAMQVPPWPHSNGMFAPWSELEAWLRPYVFNIHYELRNNESVPSMKSLLFIRDKDKIRAGILTKGAPELVCSAGDWLLRDNDSSVLGIRKIIGEEFKQFYVNQEDELRTASFGMP